MEIYNDRGKNRVSKNDCLGIFLVILVLGVLFGIAWLVIQAQ